MIKNTPRNYSNDLDRRRQGLDSISENLLPDVETTDAGKIMKVGEDGKWHLGSDENTIIEANPDEQPTVDLENLKIGSTVYSVKNPELRTVKSFKLTMSNGGQYNTNKPIIEFFNEAGQEASITSSDYTVECDKTYAGNAGMDQVCSISTPDTPGTFTYTFVNDFDIENYNLIKLTRGGTFVNDIAKNIKLELSADGENYLTIYDETTITWSDAAPYHLISLKDGSEASTLLPIVTSADNGKVLGVVNGKWNTAPAPSSLPSVSSGDTGLFLEVNQGGTWVKSNYRPMMSIKAVLNNGVINFNGKYPYPSGIYTYSQMNYQFNYTRFIIEFDNVIDGVTHKELFVLCEVYEVSSNEIHAIFKNANASHQIECVGRSTQTIDSGTATYT